MDHGRAGATFRAIRIKKHWRQQDVATRAGVPRAAVSYLERGRLASLTLDQIERIADALDVRLDLVIRWHGGDLDRLLNARHSALHESVARSFERLPGWVLAPEVSFSIYGERGVIDILAWHAATRTLLVIELKTEIVDVNELLGSVDRKKRLALKVARDRGWDPMSVSAWLIVESSSNRRRVAHHATVMRAAFPLDGRSIYAWLRGPAGSVAALSFWSYARDRSTRRSLATVKRVRRSRAKAA